MDDDKYIRDWHSALRSCLRGLQRHRRAVQVAKPTNSDKSKMPAIRCGWSPPSSNRYVWRSLKPIRWR